MYVIKTSYKAMSLTSPFFFYMEQVMVKLELNLPWVSRELSLLFLVHLDVQKLTLIASLTEANLSLAMGSFVLD